MPETKAQGESGLERFRKNLAALLRVPKSEIESLEAKRPKRHKQSDSPEDDKG